MDGKVKLDGPGEGDAGPADSGTSLNDCGSGN